MTIYHFDGSFEGFLCAVSRCLERHEQHPDFRHGEQDHEPGLFSGETCPVPTDLEQALAFRNRFVKTVSQPAFATARYAFHSQGRGIEQRVWEYLKLGLELGRKLQGLLAMEPVHTVERAARQVAHEAHKFKGFVRFSEVEQGFLYAAIEPQADILSLIAPHFAERIGDRPWLIHDLGRSLAAACRSGQWRLIRDIDRNAAPALTAEEQEWRDLWQRYFRRLAIPERLNPRLQQQHVPLRVRSHLSEFEGGN